MTEPEPAASSLPVTAGQLDAAVNAAVERAVAATRGQRATVEVASHMVIVILVLISATVLRIRAELDTATISTVYGLALGHSATMLIHRNTGARRNGHG